MRVKLLRDMVVAGATEKPVRGVTPADPSKFLPKYGSIGETFDFDPGKARELCSIGSATDDLKFDVSGLLAEKTKREREVREYNSVKKEVK